MKRTLSILALLTVALSVAWTEPAPSVLEAASACEPIGVGWRCSVFTECNTQLLCVEELPVNATYCRCCPPPCQNPPCEIQPCETRLVGVSCGC